MEQNGTPWGATKGWESHMTDKHGRRNTITTGPPGRSYTNGNKITAWAHNIIQHCRTHVPYEQHAKYMTSIQAETSLDPHLLQGLADVINATTIHDTIPHNPFIPTPTFSNDSLPVGHSPTIINAAGNNIDWEAVIATLTHSRSWIILTDDSQTKTLKSHLSTPILTTIPANTISIWGRSFWAGTGGLFPETNETPIHVYTSPMVTPLQQTRILDTIYMRMTHGGSLSPNPTIIASKLSSETPPNIVSLLQSQDSAAKLQLLSGVITEHITQGWSGFVPSRLQQKLYRTLHKTIIHHQHSTWLKRNEVAHPITPFLNPVDYGRKPARKRQLLEDEEDNPKDIRWTKQRETAMIRERMWAGEPIPASSKKRKRVHMVSSLSDSDSSSETDEWPSPARKRPAHSKERSAMTENISIRSRERTYTTRPVPPYTNSDSAVEAEGRSPTRTKTQYRRRTRKELTTYIHTLSGPQQPRRRNIGIRGRGGVGRLGGVEEATRTTGARRDELCTPSQPTVLTPHTHIPSTHTQCTLHRSKTTFNPPSSDPEEVRGSLTGRLPATPEPEASTHINTLPHNEPANHPQLTSLNTETRGRRATTNHQQQDQEQELIDGAHRTTQKHNLSQVL